jgi:hypothetical protein
MTSRGRFHFREVRETIVMAKETATAPTPPASTIRAGAP